MHCHEWAHVWTPEEIILASIFAAVVFHFICSCDTVAAPVLGVWLCVWLMLHRGLGNWQLTVDDHLRQRVAYFGPSTVQLNGLFSEAFWKFSFIFGNVPKTYINLPEACAQYTHLTWSTTWRQLQSFKSGLVTHANAGKNCPHWNLSNLSVAHFFF